MPDEISPAQRFSPFSFAVISDLHLSEDDGIARLRRFKEMLADWPNLELILITGDIMWPGEPEALREELTFDRPVYVLFGNNDYPDLEMLESVLGTRDYSFVHRNCLFLMTWNCMAPNVSEHHRGLWSPQQQQWIEQQLEQARQHHISKIIFCSHVPPFHPDGYFPKFFLFEQGATQLTNWIEHDHLDAALFGHIHQPLQWSQQECEIIVTPSLNWNFQRIEGKARKTQGGACRLVHVAENSITTELIPVRLEE